VQLPAVVGGATGYSMFMDFTGSNINLATSLGFKVGSGAAHTVVASPPPQLVYMVISNGSSAPTVAGFSAQ
jgi:hypothetical protein